MEKFGHLSWQSNLGTWLYRVAVNTCLGWLSREKRRSRMLERVCEEQQVVVTSPGQNLPTVMADDLQQLYAQIAELAPVDRLLVSLYLEDMNSN